MRYLGEDFLLFILLIFNEVPGSVVLRLSLILEKSQPLTSTISSVPFFLLLLVFPLCISFVIVPQFLVYFVFFHSFFSFHSVLEVSIDIS